MFGGLTYIGNASNLVVRAVASRRGVRMPGFLPFMLWAAVIMLPVLAVVSAVFFRS
jgi:Na+/H+ antiporter NhaD/arsenite permease-like protein